LFLMAELGFVGGFGGPDGVSLILFTQGFATAGSSISLTYSQSAQACRIRREGSEEDGVIIQTAPLTGAPCRWFWVREFN